MKIVAHIYARKRGAIGLWREFFVDLDVDHPTTEKVRLACYDAGYEHIHNICWAPKENNVERRG